MSDAKPRATAAEGDGESSPPPPLFAPVVVQRTAEAAIDQLIDGIERAHLRPGDPLPKESELARQLGISKSTLRQALRILEGAGMLEVRRGATGGVFLASDLVPSDVIDATRHVEESAVADVLIARRLIEGAVTEIAVGAATAEDWRDMERSIELLREHCDDTMLVMRADAMFHRAVVRACRNSTLERAMQGIARDLVPIRRQYLAGDDSEGRVAAIHQRQLDVMRSRNLSELALVMDAHFTMLEQAFTDAIGGRWSELFGRGPHHFVVRLTGPGVGAYLAQLPFDPVHRRDRSE